MMQWISDVLSPSRETFPAFGLGTAPTLSGGELGSDGVSYGFSLMRGKRGNMEDYHIAQFKKHGRTGEVIGLFGVFDGHGGPNAADYVRSNLFKNLFNHQKFPTAIAEALAETYHTTDEQYMKQDAGGKREDGCTAVTAVLYQNSLVIANVGDSRGVLCRAGQAVQVTVDHKPNDKAERERIEGLGGVVVWAGTWRVGGVLAVSRAFGDRPIKKYVVSTPHVQKECLSQHDEFLVMCSDGVWDVVSNEEAVTLVRGIADAKLAAEKLTDMAFARGSADNISCLVVRFRPPTS